MSFGSSLLLTPAQESGIDMQLFAGSFQGHRRALYLLQISNSHIIYFNADKLMFQNIEQIFSF